MAQTLKNDSVLLYKLSHMEKPRHLTDHAIYYGCLGSGKSYAAKSEIRQIIELTDDLVVIIDYYNEYSEFIGNDRVEVLNFYSDENYSIENIEKFYNLHSRISVTRMC